MIEALVVGAGAQARYAVQTLRSTGSHRVIGLIDTFGNTALWGTEVDGVPVLGGLDALADHPARPGLAVLVAIADRAVKRRVAATLEAAGHSFLSAIHPAAQIAADAVIGRGCIINAGAVVEMGCRIGDHVIVHASAVIEHDARLGNFVNIGPGVAMAGRVRVDDGAIVYTGATVVPDRHIGADAVVGAGAVVLADVAPGTTVVGVPARPIGKD